MREYVSQTNKQTNKVGAGEKVYQLGTPTALGEDPRLVPSTFMGQPAAKPPVTLAPENLTPSSGLQGYVNSHAHTGHHIYTRLKKLKEGRWLLSTNDT